MFREKWVVILLLVSAAAWAQVTVEEEISTDSVDLFVKQKAEKSQVSATLALYSSLIIPGAGHHYLDRKKAALAYFTCDMAAIFGLIFSEQYSRKLSNDASTYAWFYAGARGSSGEDSRYWQALGDFQDIDGYNRVQDLNRTPEQKYTSTELWWHWADQSYQDEYNTIRRNSQRFHVAATFFAGVLLLDRIISFIDLRASTRRQSAVSSSSRLVPSLAVDFSKVSFNISTQF